MNTIILLIAITCTPGELCTAYVVPTMGPYQSYAECSVDSTKLNEHSRISENVRWVCSTTQDIPKHLHPEKRLPLGFSDQIEVSE